MTTPWGNGPLEGHFNRLNAIKRQMYGRAGFELLAAWDEYLRKPCLGKSHHKTTLDPVIYAIERAIHLCIVPTCRCGDRRSYAKTINRILDKSLHLRW
jgi:hypothetical protein